MVVTRCQCLHLRSTARTDADDVAPLMCLCPAAQVPQSSWSVNLPHLGLLFVLDRCEALWNFRAPFWCSCLLTANLTFRATPHPLSPLCKAAFIIASAHFLKLHSCCLRRAILSSRPSTEEACLGREHDGRFSLPNVVDLLQLGRQLARLYQPHEFASQLAGYCTLQMWLSMCEEGGQERFCNWCAAFIPFVLRKCIRSIRNFTAIFSLISVVLSRQISVKLKGQLGSSVLRHPV